MKAKPLKHRIDLNRLVGAWFSHKCQLKAKHPSCGLCRGGVFPPRRYNS